MFGRNYQELASSYAAMGAMLEAGVDLFGVLKFQEDSGVEKEVASRIGARLRSGATLNSALTRENLPPLDVALVKAGEATGELPAVLKLLGDYYSGRASLDRTLKAALAKPFVLFSVAVVCTSLPPYVLGYLTLWQFLALTVLPVAITVGVFILFFELVWRATRNPELDRWLDQKFATLSVLKPLSAPIAEERFFMSFLICIKAGATLEILTQILTLVSEHPTLKGAARFLPSVAPKDGLAAAIERTRLFPPDVISGIRVGEQTGRLEQQLQIILKECRGRIDFNLKVFKDWAPRALYALIAGFVILNILVIALR